MDIRLLATVFGTVFLAELGDKTQLATLLFAADPRASRLTVFVGAALALVVSAALGVLAGGAVARVMDPRWLSRLAGGGFVALGLWMLLRG